MKRIAAFALVEVSLVVGGAWANRVFPGIPAWALGVAVVVCLGLAAALFLWSLREETVDDKKIRKAIHQELKDRDYRIEKLREAVSRLPQKSLGDGHTYAELPPGTNVVTMADGSIRLALRKQIGATFTAPPSTASAVLSKRPDGS